MGNSQAKESRPSSSRGHARRHSSNNAALSASTAPGASQDASAAAMYSSRGGRSSRPDLSFLGLGTAGPSTDRDPALEPRRETRAEREARKLEKERVVRAQERDRSIREEGVDGAYLVTLGTYTGPEDFSKPIVRQLQVRLPSFSGAPPPRPSPPLTRCRLSDDWRPSGRASTTTPTRGPNTSS
jgi:hypothetical protein